MLVARSKLPTLLLLAVLSSSNLPAHADGPAAPDVAAAIARLRARITDAQARLAAAKDPVERARLLLATGRHDEAHALVGELFAAGREGRLAAVEALFAVQDFATLEPLVLALRAAAGEPEVRRQLYRYWVTVDDLAGLEKALDERSAPDAVDRLARGQLMLALLEPELAERHYQAALDGAKSDADRARAHHGLGKVAYRKSDYDRSLIHLVRALEISAPDADLLMSLFETLLRFGRTEEAIDLAELAVSIAPYHELAHYQLGNGYSRNNYTQLEAAYPKAFAGGAGPAETAMRAGSRAFATGDLGAARRAFLDALALCPEYGRAHNGLAKTLEAERLRVEVHRASYEERFAAAPMPEVPGIERFVLNWQDLTPRHRKRVALSIAPWKRYVPVLVEAGASFYIKPLHERLSETPHQQLLRDLRIDYDSRLWDDVRGCGGFHTVTGIEDVERTIFSRYDTVLHELTHQVHATFPAEDRRQIQELYRKTKERDATQRTAGSGDAFLSRYAGASVWEYFAEGANAWGSPRRDRFDTREIVRDRLETKDPQLYALVQKLLAREDVTRSYAVAAVGRGHEALRRGELEAAIADYRRALELAPGDEEATSALLFGLEARGAAEEALLLAGPSAVAQPESPTLALRQASALWSAGRGLGAAISTLEAARPKVRAEERYLVDLEIGRLHWVKGDAESALAAFDTVLSYQADNPEALWGAALAHALAERWSEAWPLYDKAVQVRTGVVALRTDYGRDLMRAGELASAPEQIQAALLLDPDDPQALALKAWWALGEGHVEEAGQIVAQAREHGPWSDLALIVQAYVERLQGRFEDAHRTLEPLRQRMADDSPPKLVYRPKQATWEQVHTLPAVERALVPKQE